VNNVTDLIAQLIESEIRLGLVLVDVAMPSLMEGNITAFEDARYRAECTYLRARAQIRGLPEHSKQIHSAQLQALRSTIDELPDLPKNAMTEHQALHLDAPGRSKCLFPALSR
jgi:hypothetical protein